LNLPNSITIARLLITAGTFVCLELVSDPNAPEPSLVWTAFALFLVAAISDALDGYFARRYGMVTAFGRVADPFADKVLICGTLVILLKFPVVRELLSHWFVVVIIAREFLVTAVRGLVEASGTPFPADRFGKYKMIAQCVTASALLTLAAGMTQFHWLAEWGIWITLVLTVGSGASYVFKARKILFAS
jgi:CDP-diacylglycerol--glycerol-3-phosphate 3-phosphatidyltransferase